MSEDLISRRAALEWLKTEWDGMVTSVFDGIEQLPSTDRKGHWIAEASDKILGQLDWSCSECGEGFALDIGKCPSDIGMNYCTNCGADMRGEQNE